VEHSDITKLWYDESTYLVLLSVADEDELADYASRPGLTMSSWREPDLNDQLTAVALGPTASSARAVANLPLLLRDPVMSG
jgi:hypothetical protein